MQHNGEERCSCWKGELCWDGFIIVWGTASMRVSWHGVTTEETVKSGGERKNVEERGKT